MRQEQKTTPILAVIVLLVILACGYIGYTNSMRPMPPTLRGMGTPLPTSTKLVRELGFCYEYVTDLCIASFGRDNAKHLLVVFKNHKPASAEFYINVKHADQSELYKCQPVNLSPGSSYCMGKNIPEGTDVTISVYSNNQRLLSSGVVPISVDVTPTSAPTKTVTPTKTIIPTKTLTPTFIPGQPTATADLRTPTPSPSFTPPSPDTLTPTPAAGTGTPSYPYP